MAKVLVVDDSPTVAMKLSLQLESAGFSVCTQKEGTQVLTTLMREKPDIVMLDITLPDLEGPEVCKLIKKHAREAQIDIPVLLYSGLSDEEMQPMADTCGADGFLHKSCPLGEMVKKLSAHIPTSSQATAES